MIPTYSEHPPLSSKTRSLAIIGCPIEHSITPRIQNAALHEIGADLVNVAFRVEPENLREAVRGARALGLLGLMVTIPHKEAVLELCDELDPAQFWQIHRSTLVNMAHVTAVTRDLRGQLQVKLKQRNESLPVSESYTHLFRQM